MFARSIVWLMCQMRLLPTYWRIARRRLEIGFFYQLTRRRLADIDNLTAMVGFVFRDAGVEFSGVGWSTYKAMGYDEKIPGICWEAPICITIYLDGRPALGMGLEWAGTTLRICQLQGVPGLTLGPELRAWPQHLVRGCIAYAEETGKVSKILLYRADKAFFYRNPDFGLRQTTFEQVLQHRQRMRRRYDGTARQLGFKMLKKYGVWRNPNYARS